MKGFEAGDCHIRLKVSEEKEGDVGFRTEYGNPEKVETSSCSEHIGSWCVRHRRQEAEP